MSPTQSKRDAWMDGLVDAILGGDPNALMAHDNIVFLDGGSQIPAADGLEAVFKALARVEADRERLLHGICDALKFLPPPTVTAGSAILRGLLKGTPHEGHNDDL